LTNKIPSGCFKDLLIIKSFCVAVICLLLPISIYSQENDLVVKAGELIYSNPDEAIKIADHILNTSQEPQETAIANALLSKSYLVKGDYKKALNYAFDKTNQFDEVAIKTRIENHIVKATLLRELFLDNQSQDYLNKAKKLVSKVTTEKDLYEYQIFLEHVNMLIDRLNTNEAIAAIEKAETQFHNFLEDNIVEKRAYYLVKERIYNSLTKYDSAFVYINKTLDLVNYPNSTNLYEKAIVYKELGHLHLQKKEFKRSEESLFLALRFAEIIKNPFLLEDINRELAINYLASNQKNKHVIYNEEFLVLNNTTEVLEQESVNTVYNLISENQESRLETEKIKFNNYAYILLAVALFILAIGLLILLKSEARKKRYNEIINYLEISRNIFMNIKPTKKLNSKGISIPEETEKSILQKLKRFETSKKYINKDMSLAVLAGQFETNTKYLSEVINKHYNDNFNTFINKLRIKYIIGKLKNDSNYINYKISFLAEESGFSSHSSFATVFKSIIGMSPGTFIDLIKKEREQIKNKKKE
jgi:AraC-like DNA-binding protein